MKGGIHRIRKRLAKAAQQTGNTIPNQKRVSVTVLVDPGLPGWCRPSYLILISNPHASEWLPTGTVSQSSKHVVVPGL